jgi:DNA primase
MGRTHYVHWCATRLAQGNGQLAVKLEDELRRRIRHHRWNSPAQKREREAVQSACQRSEVQLLQIYLHFPEFREEIHGGLEEHDLEFSVVPHRQLWQKILELRAELDPEADIVVALRTLCAGDLDLNARLGQLLWLNENHRVALMRPQMVIRAGLANLQLDRCERRYRYLTRLFDDASARRDGDEKQYYWEQISEEYQRINTLKTHLTLKLGEDTFEGALKDQSGTGP